MYSVNIDSEPRGRARLNPLDILLVVVGGAFGLGATSGVLPPFANSVVGLTMILGMLLSLHRGLFYSLGVWWGYSFFEQPWESASDFGADHPDYQIHFGPILVQPGDIIGIGFLLAVVLAMLTRRSARERLQLYPHRRRVIAAFCFLIGVAIVAGVNGYRVGNVGYTRPLRSILTISPLVLLLLTKPSDRLTRGIAVLLPCLAVGGIVLGFIARRTGATGGILLSSVFLIPLLWRRPNGIIRTLATLGGALCTALASYLSLSTVLSVLTAFGMTWTDGLKKKRFRRFFFTSLIAGIVVLTSVLVPLLGDIGTELVSPANATVFTGSFASAFNTPIDYARFKVLDRAFVYAGAIREIQTNPYKVEGGRSYSVATIFLGGTYIDWSNYAHNFPLEVFVEFGLLAGLPFIYLAIRAYLDLSKVLARPRREVEPEAVFLACFALSLLPWMIFFNYALVPNQGFLLWLSAGLVIRSQYAPLDIHSSRKPR